MNLATISILSYPFVGAALGAVMKPRQAVIAAALLGMMFLAPIAYDMPGPLPLIDKNGVIGLAMLVILLFKAPGMLWSVKWGVIDIPIVLFTLAAPASSIVNGYGVYDAGSQMVGQVLIWTVPYVVGRAMFSTPGAMEEIAKGMLWAVLLYSPLIVLEMLISPQLQRMVYGIQTFKGSTMYRMGGWRPVVFFTHGISLGLFLAMAGVSGICLYDRKAMRGQMGTGMMVGTLVLAVLSRALGGIFLLIAALGSLFPLRAARLKVLLLCFIMAGPLYSVASSFSLIPTGQAIGLIEKIDASRARSLGVRFENEHNLQKRALMRPVLGWGPHGKNRGATDEERKKAITDSYWIIVMGRYGLVGLGSGMLTVSLGAFLVVRKVPAQVLLSPRFAGVLVGACMVSMYSADLLMNGFLLPVVHLVAGGLCGLAAVRVPAPTRARVRRRVQAPGERGVARGDATA